MRLEGDPGVEELAERLAAENTLLRRRLERERLIRQKAEEIGETGLRNLYQSRQELAFLSEITTMANQAGSAGEALAPLLEYVCSYTGWQAAHAHIVGGEDAERYMRPSDIWYVGDGLDLSELRTATADYGFAMGEGLPGQVWESGKPVWLEDIAVCDNFPRREAALRSGMRAAFSTPMMVGSEVAGALEFFGPDPMPKDVALLDLMARAGTQLGRLLERDSANARLAAALMHSEQIGALLRTKIDTMMDPQAMIEPLRDPSGQIIDFVCVDANRAACRELGLSLDELRGRRQLELFPDGAKSGFTALFARCIEVGEPIALDEVPYGQDLAGGLRYFDIRAVRIGSDSINTTWRDVTDRARLSRDLARALADSERAHALARANTDALMDPQVLLECQRDSSGRIVDLVYRDVNVATCRDIGLGRDELIGHSCLETRPNLSSSGLLAHYVHCVESRQTVVLDDFPYQNELLDQVRYYDVRAAYAGSDSVSVTWRDVTDRVTSAQRIAASEERFRLLAENAGDVVFHVRDGRIAWVSPSVMDVLGAPPEHWVGRDLREIIPVEDHGAQDKVTWLSDDRAVIPRGRVTAVDGTSRWVHVYAKTFYESDGNPDGYTASLRVIDDEVRALEDAEEARRRQVQADTRYRRLMDNSAIGMALLSPDGQFEVVNRAICDFFGYDAETLRARSWQELTAADYLEADLDKVGHMLAGRIETYRMTKQYIHADGRLIWGDLSVSCLRKPNGEVENFVSQIIDITTEVRARQQIAQREQQNRVLAKRLQTQTNRLMSELKSAAAYVASILPGELDGRVRVSSRYLPSRELAGDCFDYSWIDDDNLIFYVIDVSGHGIEPSMVSISVHNLLRSKSLAAETLLEPAQVLAELNKLFDMDRHGDNYFTMWYGVYQESTRTLRYASAGHPPALAFTVGHDDLNRVLLSTEAQPVGMFEDTEFPSATYVVPPGSQILLYSDGAFELPMEDGRQWSLADFIELCTEAAANPDWSLDALIGRLRALTAGGLFEDDCSLVRLTFD